MPLFNPNVGEDDPVPLPISITGTVKCNVLF